MSVYKRFYIVELRDPLPQGFYEAKLFLTRNYIVFNPVIPTKATHFGFIVLDFGKEISVDKAFEYLMNLFNPLSVAWLDRKELLNVVNFCYLFSNKYSLYVKGNFLQDYLLDPEEEEL